ncbi:MAG: PEP-CTERM sorting domain-containing protein [Planctomycetia bacterium]|nr:PEP-CTERM sorting domain-containing protein [Planctomycetia bacterium]
MKKFILSLFCFILIFSASFAHAKILTYTFTQNYKNLVAQVTAGDVTVIPSETNINGTLEYRVTLDVVGDTTTLKSISIKDITDDPDTTDVVERMTLSSVLEEVLQKHELEFNSTVVEAGVDPSAYYNLTPTVEDHNSYIAVYAMDMSITGSQKFHFNTGSDSNSSDLLLNESKTDTDNDLNKLIAKLSADLDGNGNFSLSGSIPINFTWFPMGAINGAIPFEYTFNTDPEEVPEPATMVMMVIGLLGLGFIVHRRRKNG